MRVAAVTGAPPAAADARAALAQDAEQFEELVALGGVEAPEDLLGALASCGFEAVEQPSTVVAQRHQDRPPVTGIGVPAHEPRSFEGVDHRRDRPGDHVELGGELGHPQRPSIGGNEEKHPSLGIRDAQRGQLHDGAAP